MAQSGKRSTSTRKRRILEACHSHIGPSARQFPLATMAHCAPGAAVGGTRRCAEAARGSPLFKSLGFNGQLPVPHLDPFPAGLGSVSLAPYLGNCG